MGTERGPAGRACQNQGEGLVAFVLVISAGRHGDGLAGLAQRKGQGPARGQVVDAARVAGARAPVAVPLAVAYWTVTVCTLGPARA